VTAELTGDMKVGLVLLVAGLVLLVPGSIGMACSGTAPRRRRAILGLVESHRVPQLIPYVLVFASGVALSFTTARSSCSSDVKQRERVKRERYRESGKPGPVQ